METQDSVTDREWNNPSNWLRGRYSSASDTRLWVPKRAGIGQALNLAHPGARVFLAGMSIVPLGLLLVVIVYALTK